MPSKKSDRKTLQVMVTRPAHQAAAISRQLSMQGVEVIRFPTIVIRDLSQNPDQLETARRAADYQLLVFISANAVEYGMRALSKAGVEPKTLHAVAAIGQSTAQQLHAHGIKACACPTHASSEALLKLDLLRRMRSPARALIVRGQGGKEILAQGLRRQGVRVDYLEAYLREKPTDRPPAAWRDVPDLIMVTSQDSLQNLFAMTEKNKRPELLQTPVLLGSRSMLALHVRLGFSVPAIVARSPLDADMLAAFSQWREAR